MGKKAYRKTCKPEMPLWRVVVASKARYGYGEVYYIPKFPASEREAIISGLLLGLERVTGVKWYVLAEG